jgi:hypothetical protein
VFLAQWLALSIIIFDPPYFLTPQLETRMQARSTRLTSQNVWKRTTIAVLVTAVCGAASAQDASPWYLGADQTFTHDDNVQRTTNNTVSDTYSSTGLLGGFDQPISRQRLYGNANIRYNKFRKLTDQDNTSYGVALGWDWATIEKLAGGFNFNTERSLASRDGNQNRATTSRNVLTTDQFGANARLGGDGLLSLQANYSHGRVRYSAPEYLTSQSTSDSGSLGLFYRAGADLKLGTALRVSSTRTPYGVARVANPLGANDYSANTGKGVNFDLSADWRSTATTNVNGRLSWTEQTNSGVSDRDFSGLTWGLTANYAPTAKLGLNASINRDAGTNSSFFNVPLGTTTTDGANNNSASSAKILNESSRTTDSYGLGANFALTSTVSLTANALYSRAYLVDVRNIGGTDFIVKFTDTTRNVGLGLSYNFSRSVQLGCNYSHQSRSIFAVAGTSYSADITSCNARLTLR